jgi:hypothetical protein
LNAIVLPVGERWKTVLSEGSLKLDRKYRVNEKSTAKTTEGESTRKRKICFMNIGFRKHFPSYGLLTMKQKCSKYQPGASIQDAARLNSDLLTRWELQGVLRIIPNSLCSVVGSPVRH